MITCYLLADGHRAQRLGPGGEECAARESALLHHAHYGQLAMESEGELVTHDAQTITVRRPSFYLYLLIASLIT